jgi:hypothetical protein
MLQTVEAIIDSDGRVQLMEKVSITQPHRALVTILEEVKEESDVVDSIVGSAELLTDDLESGSKEISQMLKDSLLRSSESLSS